MALRRPLKEAAERGKQQLIQPHAPLSEEHTSNYTLDYLAFMLYWLLFCIHTLQLQVQLNKKKHWKCAPYSIHECADYTHCKTSLLSSHFPSFPLTPFSLHKELLKTSNTRKCSFTNHKNQGPNWGGEMKLMLSGIHHHNHCVCVTSHYNFWVPQKKKK